MFSLQATLVFFRSRTLLHVWCTFVSSDNGHQPGEAKKTETADKNAASPVPRSPAAGGVGDEEEDDEAPVGNSPQASGGIDISRSVEEEAIPSPDAEENAENIPGGHSLALVVEWRRSTACFE